MGHKRFFQQSLASEILNYSSVRTISKDLIENIVNAAYEEAIIIEADLIPERYPNARKFMKHGTEVKIKRFKSLEDAVRTRKIPAELREESCDRIKNKPFCGYSFKPFRGTDKRTRKVSLFECMEGTKIYCYTHKDWGLFNPAIDVKPYDDASGVEKDGAEIIVKVPSRTKKRSRYKFKFSSVPVIDSELKWAIAYSISTTHHCESKLYGIRYKHVKDKETSRQFMFCAHEIAAFLAIVDHYWNNEKNIIPLQMSQFAIPTQETVDFYTKLCNSCLIKTSKDKKPRKLNRAEKEIMLWGWIYKSNHDETFFAREMVKDYNWGFE